MKKMTTLMILSAILVLLPIEQTNILYAQENELNSTAESEINDNDDDEKDGEKEDKKDKKDEEDEKDKEDKEESKKEKPNLNYDKRLDDYKIFLTDDYIKMKIKSKNNDFEEFLKWQKEVNERKQKYEKIFAKRDSYIKENLKKLGVLSNPNYGVIYKNLNDGYEFRQNDDKFYIAASTIKVAYCMKVEDMINKNQIKRNSFLSSLPQDRSEFGGYIAYKIGQRPYGSISLDTVLYQLIVNSDNSAPSMLRNNYPGIRQEMAKLSNPSGYKANGNMVKPGFMLTLLEKLYNEPQNFKITTELMKQAPDVWGLIPKGKVSAKKYGSYMDTTSEIAIVYDKEPYIMIVYKKAGYKTPISSIGNVLSAANSIK